MVKLYELINHFSIRFKLPKKLYNIPIVDEMLNGNLTVKDGIYNIEYVENDDTVATVSYVIIDTDRLTIDVGYTFMNMTAGKIYSMDGVTNYG